MADTWFQKLLLTPLDGIPPTIMVSILKCWFKDRAIVRNELLNGLYVDEHEAKLLDYLKLYATHSVILGDAASYIAKQKNRYGDIKIFIPVYFDIEKHFGTCLQTMIAKSGGDSTPLHTSHGVQDLVTFATAYNGRTELYVNPNDTIKKTMRYIQFRYKQVHVIWMEMPLDITSIFTKRVDPHTLFVFYLLSFLSDIVACRIAILNWYIETTDAYNLMQLHATELLDLVYRLPGYDDWLLEPLQEHYENKRYIYFRKLEHFRERNMHRNYIRVYPYYLKNSKRVSRCRSYLETSWFTNGVDMKVETTQGQIYHIKENFAPHLTHQVSSLTHLCLAILVSLGDLSYVKYCGNFPETNYDQCFRARREITKLKYI